MMRLTCRSRLIVLSLALGLLLMQGMAAGAEPVRTLWLGSSSIYFHNQPKVMAMLLTELYGMPTVAELAGKSGTGVHV